MELVSILKPEAVRALSEATSKKRLFQRIAEVAESAYGIRTAEAMNALQERESLGPTGVGQGIALPHARLNCISSVTGVFMRLDRPMAFGSVDRQPVDLVFALFAPNDSGIDHLKALAAVSRTMRDTAICAKLRANNDPLTLHAVLTERQNTRAA
ncbi:PTS sugar transporter subunit IIA [Roseicyclus sp. F158]|uniref:PTS sugar transporter subunit IIA n=1 Tax=Tropicimonas omnivorans TaxID=3075590 RepID=A0ABU3DDD9_9RHOB|nr:PTS sugar transporter subunit IIA [Roseicyclus sp. F158]MDT0681554.1 PTS sugar transporter subunit IIA [Roseicyclus sp. F158]